MYVAILTETTATAPDGAVYVFTLAREPGQGLSIHRRGPGGVQVLHEGLMSERKALHALIAEKRRVREGGV